MIKIDFEFDTKHGKFADALYLAEDHSYSESEIQAMKEQRRDNWINFVDNTPPATPNHIEIDGVKYEEVYVAGHIVLKPVEANNG